MERWPAEHKIVVDDDMVIAVAYYDRNSAAVWAGQAFINHIPSVSQVLLDFDGKVKFTKINSEEARNRIDAVLEDEQLMATIRSMIDDYSWQIGNEVKSRGSLSIFDLPSIQTAEDVRTLMNVWAIEHQIRVDDEMVILLPSVGINPRQSWVGTFTLFHIPTASRYTQIGDTTVVDAVSDEIGNRMGQMMMDFVVQEKLNAKLDEFYRAAEESGFQYPSIQTPTPTPTPISKPSG